MFPVHVGLHSMMFYMFLVVPALLIPFLKELWYHGLLSNYLWMNSCRWEEISCYYFQYHCFECWMSVSRIPSSIPAHVKWYNVISFFIFLYSFRDLYIFLVASHFIRALISLSGFCLFFSLFCRSFMNEILSHYIFLGY